MSRGIRGSYVTFWVILLLSTQSFSLLQLMRKYVVTNLDVSFVIVELKLC